MEVIEQQQVLHGQEAIRIVVVDGYTLREIHFAEEAKKTYLLDVVAELIQARLKMQHG
jgi:hypothetical protein